MIQHSLDISIPFFKNTRKLIEGSVFDETDINVFAIYGQNHHRYD